MMLSAYLNFPEPDTVSHIYLEYDFKNNVYVFCFDGHEQFSCKNFYIKGFLIHIFQDYVVLSHDFGVFRNSNDFIIKNIKVLGIYKIQKKSFVYLLTKNLNILDTLTIFDSFYKNNLEQFNHYINLPSSNNNIGICTSYDCHWKHFLVDYLPGLDYCKNYIPRLLIYKTVAFCEANVLNNLGFKILYYSGLTSDCLSYLLKICRENINHIVRLKYYNANFKPDIGINLSNFLVTKKSLDKTKKVNVLLTLKFDWRFPINQIDFYAAVIEECEKIFDGCNFYIVNWVNFFGSNNSIEKTDKVEIIFNYFYKMLKNKKPQANITSINNCAIDEFIKYIYTFDHFFTFIGSMQHSIFYFTEKQEFALGTHLKNFIPHKQKFKCAFLPDECYLPPIDTKDLDIYYDLHPVEYRKECDVKLSQKDSNGPYIIDIKKSILHIKNYLIRNN